MKMPTMTVLLPVLMVPWLVSCTSLSKLGETDGDGLKRASPTELRAYLIKAFSVSDPPPLPVPMAAPTASVSKNMGSSLASGNSPQFSTTNVQEQGVDEADRLKTDGRYVYAIGAPDNRRYRNDTLRIMQVSAQGKTLTPVKQLTTTDGATLENLYLAGKQQRLVILGNQYDHNSYREAGKRPYPSIIQQQQTLLQYLDVSRPAAAKTSLQVQLDGDLVASRRIGDTLYLVLQGRPEIRGGKWLPYAGNEEQQAQNRAQLEQLKTSDFLPTYTTADGKTAPLVDTGSCYLNPQEAKQQRPGREIISIVAVDLAAETLRFNSRCFVGSSETLYASPQAMYLATTDYHYNQAQGSRSTTNIHKFAFTGKDIAFRSSGKVPGNLGWNQAQRPFRFSEQDGFLRVVTYNDQFSHPSRAVTMPYGDSPVILSVLQETGQGKLKLASQLPNRRYPKHLGKPNEQLYASRFLGDYAYLVTFQSTDPLYVLDLSNPRDPYIISELEIPGFSDYLHPVGDNLLLGIGKDAIPDPRGDFRGAWHQGVKLSLIDIRNPGKMQEVDKLILGKRGTDSAALHDHHAVTVLPAGKDLRVALPVKLHDTPQPGASSHPREHYLHTRTGLYRFEVDKQARKIRQLPPLISERGGEQYWFYPQHDRSVIIGDYVHYFHNGKFWSQNWKTGEVLATGV